MTTAFFKKGWCQDSDPEEERRREDFASFFSLTAIAAARDQDEDEDEDEMMMREDDVAPLPEIFYE